MVELLELKTQHRKLVIAQRRDAKRARMIAPPSHAAYPAKVGSLLSPVDPEFTTSFDVGDAE